MQLRARGGDTCEVDGGELIVSADGQGRESLPMACSQSCSSLNQLPSADGSHLSNPETNTHPLGPAKKVEA